MKIGDIEYTRNINFNMAGTVSEIEVVNFALGIKIRPLLVRAQVSMKTVSVATTDWGVWFENGTTTGAGSTTAGILTDSRMFNLYYQRQSLSTNGMSVTGPMPHTTWWWKILMPQITIETVGVAAGDDVQITLSYRFVELTDDEIVEIAAQRAQF